MCTLDGTVPCQLKMAAFEKQIPENVVEYHLYPRIAEGCDALQALIVLGAECMHVVNDLCRDYIWNNQRFHLSVPEQGMNLRMHTWGTLIYRVYCLCNNNTSHR